MAKVMKKVRGCTGTRKQLLILRAIARRNPDGTLLDIFQMIDIYGGKYQSMRSTLDQLIAHEMINKDQREFRGTSHIKPRALYQITDKGLNFIRPNNLPSADA